MTNLINDFFSMPLWFTIPLGTVYVALIAYFVYTLWHYHSNSLKLAMLTAALFVGQAAWAEGKWTVTNEDGSSNTFTIKRTEKGYTQTVHFRTISLSAYAGQHFTAVDMDYTFSADEDEKTVTVNEKNPTNAYMYQTGASRKYGFEVIDRAGFRLAYAERSKTWGTSVTSSGVFDEKDVTIQTSEYTADDDGYDTNGYKSVAASSYCTSGTQAYLGFLDAQLRMTLSFDAKENDDAYEYLQILFDNTSTCDNRSGAGNGNPGTPNLSRYMAGFEMNTGSTDNTYRNYTFPVTSVGDNASATNPWGHGDKWPLKNQKFKSGYRATDGRLIVPVDFSSIVLRLNASGSSGSDEWAVKNVKAHIQAIDGTAPTKSAVSVNPGRHSKGNTIYVSVAFSEIVTVSGTPTLTTTSDNNWGDLTYVDGSGTNVLTFSTTIPQNATGDLNITGISGTIQDLAGNNLSGGVTASSICTLDNDFAYTIDEFQKDGDNYLIKTHEDLIGLAGYVNGGGATTGKTFLQVADITFAHTTDWNSSTSTENNYTAIGTNIKHFSGIYDGQGHTISGIRIYKGNDSYQGLFGNISGKNAVVRNVHLADSRITGKNEVAGIVGYNYGGTVEDCTVAADVCIHTTENSSEFHGGIVGYNNYNTAVTQRCISRATLTVANGLTDCGRYGGIAGDNLKGTITDCLVLGAVIPDVDKRGTIIGRCSSGLVRNYYRQCTVAGVENATGVGNGYPGISNPEPSDITDNQGALPLYAITLPEHSAVVRTGTALPGTNNYTYDNGADINGVPYAKGSSEVNLSYDPATITEGYDVLLSVKKTSDNTAVAYTDNGNHTYTIASMPDADITVSATEIPVIAYIDADGNPQSHACTPIVSGTPSYGNSNNTEAWYYVDGTVNYSSVATLTFNDQQVNIVLCDGATLKNGNGLVSNTFINVVNGSLAIYGQSGGTGSIVCNKATRCIDVKNNIDFNGGNVSATTSNNQGIYSTYGSITVRRGSVTASGSNYAIMSYSGDIIIHGGTVDAESHCNAIYAKNNLTINGGTVTANATYTTESYYSGLRTNSGDVSILGGNVTATGQAGIVAGYTDSSNYGKRTITLGCATLADRITASSYACSTLTIADGQILSDGTDVYSGKLTSDEIAEIAGKTLSTAIPYIDADGTTKYKASHDLTFITTSTINYGNAANTEGWYCVNSDVDFSSTVTFKDQQANIILCDGATMSGEVKGSNRALNVENGSLTIYGQTLGTGTLTVSSNTANAIFASTNIDINGGVINAKSINSIGINASNGNITIRRGNITAGSSNAYGIRATTITLGCPTTADRIYASSYNGTVTIADGQTLTDGNSANTYTNTLTDEQKAAIAGKTMMKALGDISYIDENGKEQTCSNYQILSDGVFISDHKIGTTGLDTWYVASGNYTFNASYLETCGRVHIILCDGANFTVNGSSYYGIEAGSSLSIYGQSQGTGTLTANVADASGKALYVASGNLVINGGVVNANGGEYGIYIYNGNLTVNGGTINATGTKGDIHAGVKFGASMMNLSIPSAITVSEVTLQRSFANGKYATLMLPFSLNANNQTGQTLTGAKIYQFGGVQLENNEWIATANEVTTLQANTPYLVEPVTSELTSEGYLTFNLNGGTVSLQTAESAEGSTNSDWQFKGTYKRLTYGTAPMKGNIYGFASKDKTVGGVNVKAGEFVKATTGASVPPMRCYLKYNNDDEFTAEARGMTRGDEELPQTITVRFVSANGEVTGMATMNTLTGEITTDGWYTLSGIKLDGKPTTKGLYINNGNKVIIK
jgi:hypothetical protein